MKKWVGKIVVICFMLLNVACQKDRIETIEYNVDVLYEYKDEIELLFGEINVISKERMSETYRSYNAISTINYDVWQIEYTNNKQETKQTTIYNRFDFISSISEIILEEISEEIFEMIDLDVSIWINYENAPTNLNTIKDIALEYYPINLRLDHLPDDFLIVISPLENKVKEFNDSILEIQDIIKRVQIKNVLLLEGIDAYEMDYGVLLRYGSVVQEKISVKDAVDWIEANH